MPDPGGYFLSKKPCFHPVYLDARGQIRIAGDLHGLGLNGLELWQLEEPLMLPLPREADLMSLPGRAPLAMIPSLCQAVVIEDPKGPATALAAALPIGYARLLLPAAEDDGTGADLPLFGYTALAAGEDGQLYVAAALIDNPEPWSPLAHGQKELHSAIAALRRKFPRNRILRQLAYCAKTYHCRTAQNLFFGQGEAGLPTAPICNAACLGCISSQAAECCPAPQRRIDFVPTQHEAVELAVHHLARSAEAIISFGQGCEGEPLTVAPLLAAIIKETRRATRQGVINMNTNAGATSALRLVLQAGLDSIRVSLFSAVPSDYRAYHRPRGFGLHDVLASLKAARAAGCQTNLNLLVYPGFTDLPDQVEALIGFLRHSGLQNLQIRNLNIDPRRMTSFLGRGEGIGLQNLLDRLRQEFPGLRIGSYTRTGRNETGGDKRPLSRRR